MKKLLALALVAVLVFSFAACGGNEKEEPTDPANVVPTDPANEVPTDAPEAGGWTVPEKLADAALAEETVEMFNKACEKSGKELAPVALLGTQVVAGTNYAFLATEEGKTVIAIVFKGLDGEAEVLSVKDFDAAAYEGKEAPDAEEIAGGWTIGEEVTANTIDENAKAALDKALEGFAGMAYEPVALLGTQVVAGVNYAILCKGHAVIPDAVSSLYIVTVYASVDGSAEISGTEVFDIADFNA